MLHCVFSVSGAPYSNLSVSDVTAKTLQKPPIDGRKTFDAFPGRKIERFSMFANLFGLV